MSCNLTTFVSCFTAQVFDLRTSRLFPFLLFSSLEFRLRYYFHFFFSQVQSFDYQVISISSFLKFRVQIVRLFSFVLFSSLDYFQLFFSQVQSLDYQNILIFFIFSSLQFRLLYFFHFFFSQVQSQQNSRDRKDVRRLLTLHSILTLGKEGELRTFIKRLFYDLFGHVDWANLRAGEGFQLMRMFQRLLKKNLNESV